MIGEAHGLYHKSTRRLTLWCLDEHARDDGAEVPDPAALGVITDHDQLHPALGGMLVPVAQPLGALLVQADAAFRHEGEIGMGGLVDDQKRSVWKVGATDDGVIGHGGEGEGGGGGEEQHELRGLDHGMFLP